MKAPISPNLVTLLRLPLAPAAVACLILGSDLENASGPIWGVIAAAVLALIVELTDLADGWIARRYNAVSDFGKLFDPFSDAFSRFTLFLGLYAVGIADLWMILALFYRDSSVSFLRSIAATRNVVLAARTSGKVKALFQGIGTQLIFALLVLIALRPEWGLQEVPWWIMLIVVIATLVSFVDYFVGNIELLKAAWSPE